MLAHRDMVRPTPRQTPTQPIPRVQLRSATQETETLEIHTAVTMHLNQLLADYNVHEQRLRSYHWYVRGKRFFQLHDTFERLYDETSQTIDHLAERISRLGADPLCTMRGYTEHARLEEDRAPGAADHMVSRLTRDIEALNRAAILCIEAAEKDRDVATASMLEDLVRRQEENAWMLSSWLGEK